MKRNYLNPATEFLRLIKSRLKLEQIRNQRLRQELRIFKLDNNVDNIGTSTEIIS